MTFISFLVHFITAPRQQINVSILVIDSDFNIFMKSFYNKYKLSSITKFTYCDIETPASLLNLISATADQIAWNIHFICVVIWNIFFQFCII